MKTRYLLITVMWSVAAFGQEPNSDLESAPPISASAERSADELEELVAPMALYPDPLIAVMLPAAAYPVEVVKAARFVGNPNNLATLDEQPWDENVRAVARFPEVIKYMSEQLDWTTELGEAFIDQPMDLMDAIQALRAKAQSAGTLQTTPQQVVIVTNAVLERTYETQIVYVTNTIVEIVPADPQVIYVPTYNPSIVFAPPPTYVYNPAAPLISFGVGIGAGAFIANNRPNWYYGGVYYGPRGWGWGGAAFGRYRYIPPPPGFRPPPFRPRPGWRPPRPGFRPPGLPPVRPTPLPVRWRPDPGRRRGRRGRVTMADRGWGSPRPSTRPGPPVRPGTRPGGNRPPGPSTPSRPSPSPGNTRPGPGGSRPGPGGPGRGPGPGRSSSGSGLSEMNNGGQARDFSRRGASSRGNSGGPRGGNSSGPRGSSGGPNGNSSSSRGNRGGGSQ